MLQILYFIASGEISLTQSCFDDLATQDKIDFLEKHFGSKQLTLKLLKSDREKQIEIILKLSSSFQYLFYSLFNEINLKEMTKKDE